jgi:hypothetical protein
MACKLNRKGSFYEEDLRWKIQEPRGALGVARRMDVGGNRWEISDSPQSDPAMEKETL